MSAKAKINGNHAEISMKAKCEEYQCREAVNQLFWPMPSNLFRHCGGATALCMRMSNFAINILYLYRSVRRWPVGSFELGMVASDVGGVLRFDGGRDSDAAVVLQGAQETKMKAS
jgi:hypothetical protein